MLELALFKYGIKSNLKTFLVFLAILTVYFVLVIPMFDPKLGKALEEIVTAMPELMAIFGMSQLATTLVGFLASYLYGFLILMFPMIFTILTVNRLVAKQVDSGSLAYLIASPAKRRSVAFTQAMVVVLGITALITYAAVLGIVASAIAFPSQLDVPRFLVLNLGALALHLFIAGICFVCACFFNETKYSMGVGAGVPILGFVVQMLSNGGDKLEGFKYVTFFTLFNPAELVNLQPAAIWCAAALLLAATALFTTAIIIFTKKDFHV